MLMKCFFKDCLVIKIVTYVLGHEYASYGNGLNTNERMCDIDLDDENLRQGTFQRGWVNVYLIIRDVFQKQDH